MNFNFTYMFLLTLMENVVPQQIPNQHFKKILTRVLVYNGFMQPNKSYQLAFTNIGFISTTRNNF